MTGKDVQLSKSLSNCLRHRAIEMGLAINKAGFVLVKAMLDHPQMKGMTEESLEKIVVSNEKQRFQYGKSDKGDLYIRAT